ncbi:MAG: outer membrane protein assembly factor [Crocinitomicaceae bacterium]
MKLKLIYLALLICSTLSINGQINNSSVNFLTPKTYTIASIEVQGVDNYDHDAIRVISGLTIGTEVQVPGDDFGKAIKNLWDQNLFSNVEVGYTDIDELNEEIFLYIKLAGRAKLSRVRYDQNLRKGEVDKIREIVDLKSGDVITESLIKNTEKLVRGFFREKGYLRATATVTEENDTLITNSKILDIKVSKGERIKIEHINIIGNESVDISHYESPIKKRLVKFGVSDNGIRKSMKDTKQKGIFRIFSRSKFNRTAYERDKRAIIDKFNGIGLRDASILKDSVYDIDEKHIGIDIFIDQGSKFYFGDITWVGNTKYRSGVLDTILGIKNGDIYDRSRLEQRLYQSADNSDITSIYMDKGYLFFTITPVELNISEGNKINYELRISEGKEARYGEIRIMGNTKTNDHVIRRELRTKPGDLFSRADIIRTQRELSQLGYFDNEQFQINPIPNPADGTVDVEYTVVEKSSDQIELSGGFGAGRLIGTLGLTFTNFSTKNIFKKEAWSPLPSGDGQRLSIRGQSFGRGFQSYNFSFTEPWLGGKKPISFTTFMTHSNISQGTAGSDSELKIGVTSVGVGLGSRLKWPDDFFSVYTELNYSYYDLLNAESRFIFGSGYSNDISLNFTISRNSIDSPIYPRGGSNFKLLTKSTLPYSRFDGVSDYSNFSDQEKFKYAEYFKIKFTGEWYLPLSKDKKLVLVPKFGYGFMGGYSKSKGNTPFQRFYLGGNGLQGNVNFDGRELITLRGYETQNGLSTQQGDPLIAKYSMELRYPLSLNPSATIYGLAFVEAGNTYTSFKTFNPFNVKRSVGVGARVFLPMFGMLGVDIGWGFDQLSSDRVGATSENPSIKANGYTFGIFPVIGVTLGDL